MITEIAVCCTRGGHWSPYKPYPCSLASADKEKNPLETLLDRSHTSKGPVAINTAHMTTATWSSMYLLMSPKKHAAMIDTPPNAMLE